MVLTPCFWFILTTKENSPILKYITCFVFCFGISTLLPVISNGQEITLDAIGVRGGFNSDIVRIPPSEKEDFEHYDIFAQVGLPGGFTSESGWQFGYRLTGSAGVMRGAGDTGFIGTLAPGFFFRKPSWRSTVDAGVGLAYVSTEEYGSQDLGGPVQIAAHIGITIDVTERIGLGWRFHHISDAGIWGSDNRGVDVNLFELSYKFDSFPLYRY